MVTVTWKSAVSDRYYFIDCDSESQADDIVQTAADNGATEITVTR